MTLEGNHKQGNLHNEGHSPPLSRKFVCLKTDLTLYFNHEQCSQHAADFSAVYFVQFFRLDLRSSLCRHFF